MVRLCLYVKFMLNGYNQDVLEEVSIAGNSHRNLRHIIKFYMGFDVVMLNNRLLN